MPKKRPCCYAVFACWMLMQTMFRKPNAKALEFILYLAYGIANGKAAAK